MPKVIEVKEQWKPIRLKRRTMYKMRNGSMAFYHGEDPLNPRELRHLFTFDDGLASEDGAPAIGFLNLRKDGKCTIDSNAVDGLSGFDIVGLWKEAVH